MADYILFMHDDAASDDLGDWDAYLQTLKQNGVFEGGSAIGGGICMRKGAAAPGITAHLAGYIRITAATIDEASRSWLVIRTLKQEGRWRYASYHERDVGSGAKAVEHEKQPGFYNTLAAVHDGARRVPCRFCPEAAFAVFDQLTPRERDVLDVLARGIENGQIAARLKSPKRRPATMCRRSSASWRANVVNAVLAIGWSRGAGL